MARAWYCTTWWLKGEVSWNALDFLLSGKREGRNVGKGLGRNVGKGLGNGEAGLCVAPFPPPPPLPIKETPPFGAPATAGVAGGLRMDQREKTACKMVFKTLRSALGDKEDKN